MQFVVKEFIGMGGIGFIYTGPIGALFTYITVFSIGIFAIIGFISTIHYLLTRKRKKEDPGKRWLRTGKFK